MCDKIHPRSCEFVRFVLKHQMVLRRSCVMVALLLTMTVQLDDGDEKMCDV